MEWPNFVSVRGNMKFETTFPSTASPRGGILLLSKVRLLERDGEVFPMVVLPGLDIWDLFLASCPGPSRHACVYSHSNVSDKLK